MCTNYVKERFIYIGSADIIQTNHIGLKIYK